MPVAYLLNAEAPDYWFDHDQSHRGMVQAIGTVSAVATVPALLDPLLASGAPANWWNYLHAQLHSDFAFAFPMVFWPSTVSIADIDLQEGPTSWWAFANWNLHNLANSVTPTTD